MRVINNLVWNRLSISSSGDLKYFLVVFRVNSWSTFSVGTVVGVGWGFLGELLGVHKSISVVCLNISILGLVDRK